jgi:nucleoid-associated protein YgaU
MTRETKIGLLVGLAFIIVIGILLSDHLSATNESPTASLPVAGNTLRAGLGEMGSNEDVAPLLRNPVAIVPQQSVPTHEELTRHSEGTGVTLANPGYLNLNPPQPAPHARTANPLGDTSAERLRRDALAHGEDIEPIDSSNPRSATQTNPPAEPSRQPPRTAAVAASYKAESGDTLGTIALRGLGANNRANRDAIVAVNPSLKSNRNLIIAGRTYVIPTAAVARDAQAAAASPVTPVANEKVDRPARESTSTYVVQPGDTLWSIAVNELGSASGVATIRDLNQDLLGDSDRLHPNMKLRLPAKKLASAN